jgi:phytoene dehydrogenase-like protein
MTDVDAVVVGSGPNGLAAAVTLARAGLRVQVLEAQSTIGGGCRTLELGLASGIRHDICSAVHPMALASPFFREFDLRARGVEFINPDMAFAQPFDGRPAAIAYRDLARTATELDSPGWRRIFGPIVNHIDSAVDFAQGTQRALPKPGALPLLLGVAAFARSRGEALLGADGAALLGSVSAHAIGIYPSLATGGVGMLLTSLAHAVGWPIPVGGSQAITNALVDDLLAHGGSIETDCAIEAFEQMPTAHTYMFNTTPRAAAQILGNRIPGRASRGLRRFPYAAGAAAKVDFVVREPIPWTDQRVSSAGTVHLSGTARALQEAERANGAGRHAEHPFVLLSESGWHDPTRARDGLMPVWAYTHVPAGSTQDVTETVTAQIERFAPGFRDIVVASRCVPAAEMQVHNANYIGGDIGTGSASAYRLFARPRPTIDPYRLGAPGFYLCSAAAPPASGVHGMAGHHAARRALRAEFGIADPPDLSPEPIRAVS